MTELTFPAAIENCGLVAILRGLTPAEAPAIGDALVEAGFTLIEVPLNSPDPLQSISILAEQLRGRAMVGAGTVLSPSQVNKVARAGGSFVVSPNVHVPTIEATVAVGMASLPGYFTPTEAFAALEAGATALKLFPADGGSPAMLKAQRSVLPRDLNILAVGGIHSGNMAEWRAAGADGFGIGSNLYRPGKAAGEVAADARELVSNVRTPR